MDFKLRRAQRIARHLKCLRNLERHVKLDPTLAYQTLQVNYGNPFRAHKLPEMIKDCKLTLSQELQKINNGALV